MNRFMRSFNVNEPNREYIDSGELLRLANHSPEMADPPWTQKNAKAMVYLCRCLYQPQALIAGSLETKSSSPRLIQVGMVQQVQ